MVKIIIAIIAFISGLFSGIYAVYKYIDYILKINEPKQRKKIAFKDRLKQFMDEQD